MSRLTKAAVAASALAAVASMVQPAAASSHAAAGRSLQAGALVSEVPSLDTPDIGDGIDDTKIDDGRVQALAQVGDHIVFGGTFTQVADRGASRQNQAYIGAYDRASHHLSQTFLPRLNGQVWSIVPGSTPNTMYIGGDFTTVNGIAAPRIAELDVTTGQLVPGFKPSPANGTVRSLVLSGGRLFVGGTFTKLGALAHNGMASISPTTGAVDAYVTLQTAGHHNADKYPTRVPSPVGVVDMAVTPDGTQLTAIGNFRTVDGKAHDQIVQLRLGSTAATVREDWLTPYFTSPCYSGSFDSWVRSVRYSPDGSYFLVGSTGGGNKDLCDAIGRFETSSSGTSVQPTWIASTGGDSVYSMAITDSAIYAGGHFRWFNNPLAVDHAGPGAVPRPGLVALDPTTGIPLPWNPGRHPRDKGVFAMLATDSEMVLGSDTDWIGNHEYLTPKLASFPLMGGVSAPSTAVNSLPANLVRVLQTGSGTAVLEAHGTTATAVGNPGVRTDANEVSGARGAVWVGGSLYLAMGDGTFHRRSYDGSTLGADTVIDPYNDPKWSNVLTRVKNNTETYRGVPSGFENDAKSLTSMFYLNGQIYYTVYGSSYLRARRFEPGSGIISPVVKVVSGVSMPSMAGAAWVDGYLFFVRASDGLLVKIPFNGTTFGSGQVVGGPSVDGVDWRSQALFIGPGPTSTRGKSAAHPRIRPRLN